MFISKLDFLSSPPQMYFLQKRTNQTIFGGILFIIFILITMSIVTVYTLNFYLNDRYDIRYSLYKNFTSNYEKNNEIEELNRPLNFSIDLKKMDQKMEISELSGLFLILDENFTVLKRNTVISGTPAHLRFYIGYICISDCSIDENDYTDLAYLLNISYSGYKIDHQNDKIPLEKNSDKYPFYKEFYFSFAKSTFYDINWCIIKYREESGLLGLFDNLSNKKNNFTSIDIDSIEKVNAESVLEFKYEDFPFLKLKILSIINMNNNHNQYIEYIRLKKSLLDVFANIGAIFSTIFTIFNFIFKFYSKNLDNYLIIKEILYKSKTEVLNNDVKIPRSKTIKFDNINRKNKDIIYDDNKSFDTSKSVPFKSKRINISNKIKIKNNGNDNDKKVDNINYNFGNLIEVNFIQFLLNNVYFKRKNRIKEQKVIDICNKILSKYTSIDIFLYNQIIFENLLKDYKWNDNNLKYIGNNILVKQLKLIT